ncbi:uncharacterized protein LOC128553184 [Mercenaria mercenaria]|uniref:uncharacterized protein LOC128553184 n=1 Tax=Mercenaria mercenaria TaxID=6596 RepID=UPI00234F9E1F|nr:uncharacterized protein LOC128553184 [Mercenaria mercenaria]
MSDRNKQGVSHRHTITAKNIALIQEQYEKETKLREKSKTVLNGIIKPEQPENGDFISETDLEYEFLYSVSDDENGDHYSYQFDAYPAVPRSLTPVAPVDYDADYEACDHKAAFHGDRTDNGNRNKNNLKTARVKSATVVGSRKQKGCLSVRPTSASQTDEKKTGTTTNGLMRCQSNDEITKEVAFRDVDSVVSKSSSCRSKVSAENKTRSFERRKSITYDPDLEKASAYIHGGGKNFSRSNTSLSPVKYGMTHLQMNYTETNLETNQSVIFLDLLKNSHQRSQIRGEQIQNIERRLEAKRHNPHYSTSFYENKNIPDPFHRNAKKTARSVAQKQIERKEKIKQMTDEIHTGYVPTQLTMKIADRDEVEDIGNKCRYLRCHTPSS